QRRCKVAISAIYESLREFTAAAESLVAKGANQPVLRLILQAAESMERAADALDAEPPARYLSPLTYDPKTKLFVLSAGDHGDYVTTDLGLSDPAKKKWERRHPEAAPPPRGSHTLKANGDGTVTLSGGYTYTSSTSYVGAQYKELNDGDWTYDIAANTWN